MTVEHFSASSQEAGAHTEESPEYKGGSYAGQPKKKSHPHSRTAVSPISQMRKLRLTASHIEQLAHVARKKCPGS